MIQLLSTVTKYRYFFFLVGCFLLNHYGYDDLSLILFFIAILDLAHVYQDNEQNQSDISKIDYWTSKIEKSNNTYDEARVVEQWSKDINDRTEWAWNEIDKDMTEDDFIDQREEVFNEQMEKFDELLTEEEKNEGEEIKKNAQRLRLKDEDIVHNISAGIVRDKK